MSNTKASAIIRERDKSELEDEQHSRLLMSANPFSSTVGFGNEITFKSMLLPFFLIHMVQSGLGFSFICIQPMLFKESNL